MSAHSGPSAQWTHDESFQEKENKDTWVHLSNPKAISKAVSPTGTPSRSALAAEASPLGEDASSGVGGEAPAVP